MFVWNATDRLLHVLRDVMRRDQYMRLYGVKNEGYIPEGKEAEVDTWLRELSVAGAVARPLDPDAAEGTLHWEIANFELTEEQHSFLNEIFAVRLLDAPLQHPCHL